MMTDRTLQQPWSQPGWLDRASTWIEHTLQGRTIRLTGPIDQVHQVPWSTVLRVPTSGGDVYFKAPMPVLVHEAALTQALSQWRPDCILPLLAVELERGWMLLPDGGTRLREVIRAKGDSRPWEVVLPTYAALQMDLVSRREELLALGVPDRGLALLPSRFEELLADEWVLGVGHPDRLTRDEVAHLRQLLPGLTDTCHELARCGIPESLDHQDLNDGNIFVGDRGSIFFDWSEASITHPFFSLRTVVVSVELTLDLEEGAAPLEELRDAYLEPWTRYVAREDLLRAFQLARRLWMIPAALAWHRILSSLEGREREEYAYTVPWLLKELLAANA
jgi:hypothetical protein